MVWLWIGGALVAAFAVVWTWGRMIPVEHTATVAREYAATPAFLWSRIRDVEAYPTWRTDLKALEIRERDAEGRVVAWTERSRFGPLPLRVVEDEAPTRLVGRIEDARLPFGGTWTYAIEACGPDRARLTITEDGFMKSPAFRVLARHVFGYTATMKAYHDQVAASL